MTTTTPTTLCGMVAIIAMCVIDDASVDIDMC